MADKELYEGKVLLPPSPSVRQDLSRILNAVDKSDVENSVYLLGGSKNERYPIMRKNLVDEVGEERVVDLGVEGSYAIVFKEALKYFGEEENLAVSTNPLGIMRHEIYLESAKREGLVNEKSKILGMNNWQEYIKNPLIAGIEYLGMTKDKNYFSGTFSQGYKEKTGQKRPKVLGWDPRDFGA